MDRLEVKVLIDENKDPFVPFTTTDSIYYNNTTTLTQKLDSKLEKSNIIAGSNITIEDLGTDLKINAAGPDLGDKNYFYSQTTASDTWVIVHNLGKYPNVTVIDSSGNEVIGDITYNSINQITIMFRGAFKGSATLN